MPHTFPVPLKRPATGLVAGVVLAAALAVVLVLVGSDAALAAAAPASPPSGGGGGGNDPFTNLYTNVSGTFLKALAAAVAVVVGWKLLHNVHRPSMGQLAAVLLLGAVASYFILDSVNGITLLKDQVARWTH